MTWEKLEVIRNEFALRPPVSGLLGSGKPPGVARLAADGYRAAPLAAGQAGPPVSQWFPAG